ncbi:phosphatidate cytidylyltransferase [Ruminococcus sp. NK3A76]|uniref:phosphatidate cytidylyltransferase n=1 Tax=Ruminococcus sp. NK3A76 TaxID=877411 RepID=UPI00048CD67C|nr:phosphatidate cytidylyltransferase [Ruminococcus sp. NK3A76]
MKTRIISAAVAIVIAVIVLALHKTFIFELAIGFLVVVALWELFKATKLDKLKVQTYICYCYGALVCIGHIFDSAYKIGYSRLIFILFILAMLVSFFREHESIKYEQILQMFAFGYFVPFAFESLLNMNAHEECGLFMIVITLCGAWLADSGAYFAGTFFGKTKLCPKISPKKTVEGLIGGVLTNGVLMILIGLVYDYALDGPTLNYFVLFLCGMLCALLGLVGDLGASLIKRQTGIKDYGNIMPGHGGVMDRFDSVLIVAPFMYYIFAMGWII